MRPSVTRLLLLAALLCASVLAPDLSYCQMTPAYSTYTSTTADATYIYADVQVSGTTTDCPGSLAYHTGDVYNELNGIGGWYVGSPVQCDAWLDFHWLAQVAYTPGVEYPFTSSAQVTCSLVGLLWQDAPSTVGLRITQTTYKYASVSGGICTYTIFCGTRQHTCGADSVTMAAPCPHTYLVLDFLVVRTSSSSYCLPVGPAFGTETPVDCS